VDEILAQEFVAAANQMHTSLTLYQTDLSLGRRGSRGLLVQCATTGCSLLRSSTYVQAMVNDARMLEERTSIHRADMQSIMGADHFEFFLEIETKLLRQAGTNPLLIALILSRCRETREAARRSEFDAEMFRGALGQLRDEVCGALTDLRRATSYLRPLRPLYRRLLACLIGVSGCVVVGLNASMLATTTGLSVAGSAVSIAVGGAILSQAITDSSAGGSQ
jgi:hypothetical protein